MCSQWQSATKEKGSVTPKDNKGQSSEKSNIRIWTLGKLWWCFFPSFPAPPPCACMLACMCNTHACERTRTHTYTQWHTVALRTNSSFGQPGTKQRSGWCLFVKMVFLPLLGCRWPQLSDKLYSILSYLFGIPTHSHRNGVIVVIKFLSPLSAAC